MVPMSPIRAITRRDRSGGAGGGGTQAYRPLTRCGSIASIYRLWIRSGGLAIKFYVSVTTVATPATCIQYVLTFIHFASKPPPLPICRSLHRFPTPRLTLPRPSPCPVRYRIAIHLYVAPSGAPASSSRRSATRPTRIPSLTTCSRTTWTQGSSNRRLR